MAKQTSLFGKISGKLGAVVFSTSGGETISREYNPHVSNPSTPLQVNQRARMKLMSQLSACLAPVIAIRKNGLVSARNSFVKRNFNFSYAAEGVAQVSYENVQLTSGNVGLPSIAWAVNQQTTPYSFYAYFEVEPGVNVSRIVWCFFKKTDEGKLEFLESQISTERTTENLPGYFGVTFARALIDAETGKLTADYVIYAYGMSDTSEAATTRYGNLNVQSATDIANLLSTRTISYEDYQFTQTRGTSANRNSDSSAAVPSGSARVFVTPLGNGTAIGAGTFEIGTTVTVTATPTNNATFVGWRINGQTNYISRQATYSFTLRQQIDLIAVFEGGGNDSL